MIQIQPPFDIKVDFWEANFPISLVEPFDKIYKMKDGSKLMWSLFLYVDPSSYNPIRNIKGEQRLSAVQRYYKKFDKDNYSEYISAYKNIILSQAAKAFREEEDSMEARSSRLVSIEKMLGDLKVEDLKDKGYIQLMAANDKARKESLAIYKNYEQIKVIFDKEEGQIRLRGGGRENITERGGLIEIKDK